MKEKNKRKIDAFFDVVRFDRIQNWSIFKISNKEITENTTN